MMACETYPDMPQGRGDDRYKGWWLSPGNGVLICQRCGSLVDPDLVDMHNEFHLLVGGQ